MTEAGKRLIGAAAEALAVVRGEMDPAAVHLPDEVDVRSIRTRLGLSQADFAGGFGFTLNQIRDWEQGRSRPIGGVRAYLLVIDRDPEAVRRLLRLPSRAA